MRLMELHEQQITPVKVTPARCARGYERSDRALSFVTALAISWSALDGRQLRYRGVWIFRLKTPDNSNRKDLIQEKNICGIMK